MILCEKTKSPFSLRIIEQPSLVLLTIDTKIARPDFLVIFILGNGRQAMDDSDNLSKFPRLYFPVDRV